MAVTILEAEVNKTERAIKNAKDLLIVMNKLKDHKDINRATYYASDYLRVTVIKLSDLSTIRKMLRDVLGGWQDKIRNQFCSMNLFITIWAPKDKTYPIEIWYECPQDSIDEKLQKPGCKVIERRSMEYDYVCNINGDNQ